MIISIVPGRLRLLSFLKMRMLRLKLETRRQKHLCFRQSKFFGGILLEVSGLLHFTSLHVVFDTIAPARQNFEDTATIAPRKSITLSMDKRVADFLDFSLEDLEERKFTYRELQNFAKRHSIRANQKTANLLTALKKVFQVCYCKQPTKLSDVITIVHSFVGNSLGVAIK